MTRLSLILGWVGYVFFPFTEYQHHGKKPQNQNKQNKTTQKQKTRNNQQQNPTQNKKNKTNQNQTEKKQPNKMNSNIHINICIYVGSYTDIM